MRKTIFKMLPFIAIGVINTMTQAQFLSPQQVDRLPPSPADRRIHYGREPFQFGDLRLPQAPGSHPVAVVIHGGSCLGVNSPRDRYLEY